MKLLCVLARNFFVTVSLSVFLLLKILAVVLSQGTKRFVALIMLSLTLLSCWLISDKFLLFITFCLLLNIGFQVLCGFQSKTIRDKLIWLLVLTLVSSGWPLPPAFLPGAVVVRCRHSSGDFNSHLKSPPFPQFNFSSALNTSRPPW